MLVGPYSVSRLGLVNFDLSVFARHCGGFWEGVKHIPSIKV